MGTGNPKPIRILVVDDMPIVRVTLRRILEKEGYSCREASEGGEALDLLSEEPAELLLCDIQMPGMGGLDLVRALQPRIPEPSIVMVSSVEEAETAVEWSQQASPSFS